MNDTTRQSTLETFKTLYNPDLKVDSAHLHCIRDWPIHDYTAISPDSYFIASATAFQVYSTAGYREKCWRSQAMLERLQFLESSTILAKLAKVSDIFQQF